MSELDAKLIKVRASNPGTPAWLGESDYESEYKPGGWDVNLRIMQLIEKEEVFALDLVEFRLPVAGFSETRRYILKTCEKFTNLIRNYEGVIFVLNLDI